MYRKVMSFLEEWKDSRHRKPLILQGARQVGKTYSILEFGRIHYVQAFVFLLYMSMFAAGISYITATLYVFFKDTIQVVSIVVQAAFWLTPIVWDIDAMPELAQRILTYNQKHNQYQLHQQC